MPDGSSRVPNSARVLGVAHPWSSTWLIELSQEVRNKWDSLGSVSAQKPSKKIKTIESDFLHALRLNQNLLHPRPLF